MNPQDTHNMTTQNHIDTFRAELQTAFREKDYRKTESITELSPSGKYRLEASEYVSAHMSWEITQATVFDAVTSAQVCSFLVNESRFFYGWACVGETEYLICAEDIFGGQTVLNLNQGRIEGYSPGEDGFIWTDFLVSPDGSKLATIGCYWACPYELQVFDFREPLRLPLPLIFEADLLDNDEIMVCWLDNETLKMKGIQRERERETFEGGGFRMKIISETPVSRTISIP